MTICGGQAVFEQSRKLAEYENRKVAITFNVNNEQGAETEVLRALELAKVTVFGALGLVSQSTVGIAGAPGATVTAEKPPQEKAKRQTKAEKEAAEVAAKALITGVNADPLADLTGGTAPAAQATASASADDGLDFLNQPAAAENVTDKTLTEAASRLAQALKDAKKPTNVIRKLVDNYAPFPLSLADIPQAARAEFLTKLAALA